MRGIMRELYICTYMERMEKDGKNNLIPRAKREKIKSHHFGFETFGRF